MKRAVKCACSLLSCFLCCFCVAGVGGTLGAAARRHHQVARFMYIILLVAVTSLAWAFYNLPTWVDSASYLSVLPNFRGCNASNATAARDTGLAAWLLEHELGASTLSVPERLCFGALSAHRVLFALAAFHGMLALVMIGATGDRRALRYELQHGWWLIKLGLLAALGLAAFLVLDDTFVSAYSWAAFIGALVFTAVQVILLVEFAHRTNETLAGVARRAHTDRDEQGRCGAFAGSCAIVVLAYVVAIAFIVLAYDSMPAPACSYVVVGTTVTLGLALFITFGGFLAMRTGRGGLLPASIVCVYGAYLTWSAFSPLALVDLGCIAMTAAELTVDGPNTTISRVVHFATLHDLSKDAQHVIMIGAAVLALAYTAFRTSTLADRAVVNSDGTEDAANENDGAALRSVRPRRDASRDGEVSEEGDDDAQAADDTGPDTPAPYSFSWFHIMLMLAAMYAAMILTGWNQLHAAFGTHSSETVFINHTGTSVFVKLATAWFTMMLYLWTVYVPFVRSRCGRSSAPQI